MTSDDGANEPTGVLATRMLAMPKDANPSGDIFGGWLMSQMDIAGGITAEGHAHGRVATVGVEAMSFHRPVRVGDVVCCYALVERTGTTSITVRVEAWTLNRLDQVHRTKVTEGLFTYVGLDEHGHKRPMPQARSGA
jgi:acyl-CoA thioesterase YciA